MILPAAPTDFDARRDARRAESIRTSGASEGPYTFAGVTWGDGSDLVGTPDYMTRDSGGGWTLDVWARGLPEAEVQRVVAADGAVSFAFDARGNYVPARPGLSPMGWGLLALAAFMVLQ